MKVKAKKIRIGKIKRRGRKEARREKRKKKKEETKSEKDNGG